MPNLKELYSNGLVWRAESGEHKDSSLIPITATPSSDGWQDRSSSDLLFRSKVFYLPFEIGENCLLASDRPKLPSSAIHEWIVPQLLDNAKHKKNIFLLPSFIILAHLLRNAFLLYSGEKSFSNKHIFWIGRSVWPSPYTLLELSNQPSHGERKVDLLSRSLLIDPRNEKDLFWCLDTVIRSDSAPIVIAATEGLSFANTRRLLLAAKKSNSLGILIRSQKDIPLPSAAITRWKSVQIPSQAGQPTWKLELLSSKGGRPSCSSWFITQQVKQSGWFDEEISLYLSPEFGDRSAEQLEKQAEICPLNEQKAASLVG